MSNPREVTALVAGAVQRRRCTIALLAAELAAGPTRGSALLRQALKDVSDGVRSVAEADSAGWSSGPGCLRRSFNARLYDGEDLLAVVDAWWPQAGVAAEVDSREWHLSPEDWERTMRRHDELSARGLRRPALLAEAAAAGTRAGGRHRPGHPGPAAARTRPRAVVRTLRRAEARMPLAEAADARVG